MSDKSFEQQVKEELSDLRIKPNAAVWESVSASLQKERKRRWAIWLVVLLVGLTSAGFWWTSQNTIIDKNQENILSQQKSKVSLSEKSNTEILSSQKQSDILEGKHLTVDQFKQLNKLTGTELANSKNNNSKNTGATHPFGNDTATFIAKTTTDAKLITTEPIQLLDTIISKSAEITKSKPTSSNLQNTTTGSNSLDTMMITTEKTSISDTTISQKDTALIASLYIDTTKGITASKKKNEWQWKIGLTGGISGIRNSLASLLGGANKSAYSEAIRGNASPIPPSGVTGSSSSNRPVVRDAFSFGFSIEVLKSIGKRERSNLGITAAYNFYKTTTGIGTQNIGTVRFDNVNLSNVGNSYYSIKDSSSYSSSYHFIHLGIQHYQSLKWFKRIDMKWFAGAGVNFLLGTNGLHLGYDSTGAYLFQNKTLFRSVQLDISTGLAFSLGKKKEIQLTPHVQYMLSNLSKQEGVNQHLFRPALRISFLLGKKK